MRRPTVAVLVGLLLSTGCSGETEEKKKGLAFAPCGDKVDLSQATTRTPSELDITCATLTVPIDYEDPKGATLGITVVKVHRKASKGVKGSVVFNPGGPGQPGLGNVAHWSSSVSDALLERFDLVTYDPRGTGTSAPINCPAIAEDKQVTPYPDVLSDAGYARLIAVFQHQTEACTGLLGDRAALFTTQTAAQDVDRLRAALGEDKLTYVGFSYGAKLGAEYARRFPANIRGMVLDAPGDPNLDPIAGAERQIAGIEHAFGEYAKSCSKRESCTDLRDPKRVVLDLVAKANAHPIPSGRSADTLPAGGVDVLAGVLALLYDDNSWPQLDEALTDAIGNDSGGLFEAAESFDSVQDDDPTHPDPGDANLVINCNDAPAGPTRAQVTAAARRMLAANPVFGAYGTPSLVGCQQWQPVRHPLAVPTTSTAVPVLVVGTVHDPVTPYAGAKGMTTALGTATLLTWEGEGHTAYLRNACISDAVDSYLLTLTPPAAGTRCAA